MRTAPHLERPSDNPSPASSPGELRLPDLPVLPFLPRIIALLAEKGRLVLKAEPGAGKTSLVPLAMARDTGIGGKILVLEPRRMAAVAAARRAAWLGGGILGQEVGYRVKGDSRASRDTRLEFMTHGVFLRILQSDPELASAGAVIFDEFHERSWQNDLCLAICRDLAVMREDLRLLVMSATIDTALLEARLEASSICVPGIVHPVETRYRALLPRERVAAAAAGEALSLSEECGGDVLVFLPGMAQIQDAASILSRLAPEIGICRLHSSIPLAEQMRVLEPGPGEARRIILATSIAETSLTVPRVRAVVDTGLARMNRIHPGSGLNRLLTETIAEDRADQRRGRAGRIAPGICLRLWSRQDRLPERTVPEIFRSELSSAYLESALWGAPGREDLPWLDAPPESAWKAARDVLSMLGALDLEGRISERGRRMAGFGLEPRLAALIMEGAARGEPARACFLAALIESQTSSPDPGCDLDRRAEFLSPEALGKVREEARRLESQLASENRRARPKSISPGASTGAFVAAGFPDRIARAVRSEGGQATFQLATGRLLGASGELASSSWIVAIDADAGAGAEPGRLHSGAALSEESALELLAPRARDSVVIEWSGAGYKARKRREAEAFILSDTPIGRPDASALRESFARHIVDRGLAVLPWDEECKNLLARIRAFWRSRFGESGSDPSSDAPPLSFPFPDDSSLAATAKAWLLPAIRAEANPVMEAKGLARALGGIVPARYREAFGVDAPDSISLPAGMRRRLDYGTEGTVRLEAGIHEFFGLRIHPRALGKPIVACLLSPAGRPVQITTDIPGFWRGSWKDVRKDLRGRYPRHDWPEDPSTAQPRTGSRKPRPG